MDELLEALRNDSNDEVALLALLRDNFLDMDAVSKREGYDILPEVASCPKHVIYYVAKYIEILKEAKD